MRQLLLILSSFVEKVVDILSTTFGLLLTILLWCFNYIGGYKVAFSVVFIAVLLDMGWGIAASLKQGKFTYSELARDTIRKIAAYGSALLLTIVLENIVMGSHTIGLDDGSSYRFAVDTVAAIIAAVEAWSVCGNILIVWPTASFFKIIRFSLVGEIARKLGVSEDEVKHVFETNGKFKDINKSNNDKSVSE